VQAGSQRLETNSLVGGSFKIQEKPDTAIKRILQDKLGVTPVDILNVKVTTNDKGGALSCEEYVCSDIFGTLRCKNNHY